MNQLRTRSAVVASLLSLFPALPLLAGEIRGRLLVSDRGDRPAAGVTVSAVAWETPGEEARREAKGGDAPKPFATATTGADGSFVLALPAEPGKEKLFRVRAEGAGVVPVLFEDVWDVSETDDLGEHLLSAASALTGTVVDPSGAPLAGAEVTLEPGGAGAADPSFRTLTRKVTTGPEGVFRFEEAGATGNRLSVRKDGLAPASASAVRSGGLAHPLALSAGVPLAGAVRDAQKRPVANVLVRFDGVKAATPWVLTGEDGGFSIAHAPDGRGTLVVDAGDSGWAAKPDVKLPMPEGRTLTVVLASPASLVGKVVDERTGRAVPRARVFVKGNAFARLVRSGPDGSYALKGVPPEAYRLTVDEARYVPWARPSLALSPGEGKRLDVALTPGATLSGKVVDEAGVPVAAARGSLTRGGENAIAGIRRMLRAGSEITAFRSRPDGTFTATRLAPGENQRLFVSHADFERATVAGLALPAGGTKPGVTVVMKRGATITGVVRNGDGQPVADAEVQLDPSMNIRGGAGGNLMNVVRLGGPSQRPKVKTGADGAFAIKGMSVGEYAVVVKKPGFATERVDPVKVGEQGVEPVSVTLGPGAAIAGAIRRKSGDGAEGYMVRANLVGGGGRGGRGGGPGGPGGGPAAMLTAIAADAPTGPDGAFLIDGLKAGQVYDVSAFGGAGMGPQKRGIVAPATGQDIVVTGMGRMSGVVLDAKSGQPIRNFSVSYEPDRGGGMVFVMRVAGGRSGVGVKRDFQTEDGAFALEDVAAGTWTAVVEAKGYQTAKVSGLVVEDGGSRDGVEVRATQGALLKGKVSDAKTGRPVANATVSVEPAGTGGPGGMFGRGGMMALDGGDDLTTDAEGVFTVEGIAPGRVKVTAKSPDYADGSEVADVKETGGNVEVKLVSGGSVSGVVVTNGQPAPGANVSLAGAGEAGFGRILGGGQTTTSDATGRFTFDHLTTGRYTASAGMNGKSSNLAEVVLQPGDSRNDLVLSLSAGTSIQGIVSGLPDGWHSQTTVIATGIESFFATTRVGNDGSFRIDGVPAGPVTLRAQAGDGLGTSRSASKQVTASDDVPVLQAEIVFDPGFTLSGHVVRAGQPVPNAVVAANLQGAGGRQSTARSDESGTYALLGLQEGAYTVTANSDPLAGGVSMVRQTVNLTADQSLDLTFPTARVGGVVSDAAGKQPLADATVTLAAAPGAATPMQRMATTDSTGRFQFTDVAPQAYTLNASKPDYQFDKRTLTAADDGSTDALSIELQRGSGLELQARDGIFGVPLKSINVRVADGAGSTVAQASIALDSNGIGDVTSLRPGTFTVYVSGSGYATVTLTGISVPSQTIPVTLTPGGTADITVGPKSFAKGPVRATLRTAAGAPYPIGFFATDGRIVINPDATGQAGRRTLQNLAPGSYVLAVDGGGGQTFTINEGGVTPVALP